MAIITNIQVFISLVPLTKKVGSDGDIFPLDRHVNNTVPYHTYTQLLLGIRDYLLGSPQCLLQRIDNVADQTLGRRILIQL